MAKYVVTRKDVCAGLLYKPDNNRIKIYDGNNKEVMLPQFNEALGGFRISVSTGIPCRGMLFDVNALGLADDLVYTTPTSYPIEGVTPNLPIQNKFLVGNYSELGELLGYLGYGEFLTQSDLRKIYRTLITNDRWLNHHKELFGQEILPCLEDEGFPFELYENLSKIGDFGCGKPHVEEPGYSLVKKRKIV